MWFQLASHLSLSLQRCQQETTSTEFLDWMKYLEQQDNTHTKMDYYLAQIAARISGMFSKEPEKFKTEDFLMKFSYKKKKKALTEKEVEEVIEKRTQNHKNFFSVMLGRKK